MIITQSPTSPGTLRVADLSTKWRGEPSNEVKNETSPFHGEVDERSETGEV